MYRVASACLALVFALCAQTGAASAGGGFQGPKASTARGGFASVASYHGRKWHRPVHRYHRRWRPASPLFLDRRHAYPVQVHVNQTVAPVTVLPAALAVPSVADLPAATGIREARPSEPAVYVLNESLRSESNLYGSRGRSLGPRIITLSDGENWASDAPVPFGAKIIHLAVPVGRPR
jgi:hypothetical protein